MSSRPEPDAGDRAAPINMPREIGGCQIQRILGSGGMATVYAALQAQPRRTVAIKVLRTAPNDEAALRRFRREVEILGRLRHPVIAQVFSAGVHEEGGRVPFFVMEYIPGSRTITDYADQKSLTIPERLKLFCKVCAGVEYGHKHRVIHRDLKPGNILINENGEPKIIDFGVARVTEVDVQSQTLHTEHGRLIGTIQYMAPEQLDATMPDIDARCDVYALGVLLYRLLTGRAPHELSGLTLFTAAQVIRRDQPPLPSSVRPELKGDLDVIVMKALATDRSMRYPSSAELARDVLRYLGNKPIEARPAGVLYRARLFTRRHRPWVIGGSVAATIMCAAIALLVLQRWWLLRNRSEAATGMPSAALAEGEGEDGGNNNPAERDVSSTPIPSPAAPGAGGTRSPEGDAAGNRAAPEQLLAPAHSGAITALSFDPSGTLLASAGSDLTVQVWDVPGGRVRASAMQTQTAARILRFARNERVVLALLAGRRLARIDAESGRLMPLAPALDVDARDIAVHPFTNQLAYSGDDSTARVTGPAGRRELVRRGTRGSYGSLAFSRDGRSLAGGSDRGSITQWSLEDERAVRTCDAGAVPIVALSYTATESIVALVADGTAVHWQPADEAARPKIVPLIIAGEGDAGADEAPSIFAATIDADGRLGAVLTEHGVAFHDFASGEWREAMVAVLPTESRAIIALSADGARLALGSSEGTIRIVPVPPAAP